jgi:hypothetical protein
MLQCTYNLPGFRLVTVASTGKAVDPLQCEDINECQVYTHTHTHTRTHAHTHTHTHTHTQSPPVRGYQ